MIHHNRRHSAANIAAGLGPREPDQEPAKELTKEPVNKIEANKTNEDGLNSSLQLRTCLPSA
jgi:hypothetical protein